MGFDPDQPGPRVWLCQPAGAAPPRGWCLRLRTCLSRFGQAPEGKTLASGGLQGAESLRVVSERGALFTALRTAESAVRRPGAWGASTWVPPLAATD